MRLHFGLGSYDSVWLTNEIECLIVFKLILNTAAEAWWMVHHCSAILSVAGNRNQENFHTSFSLSITHFKEMHEMHAFQLEMHKMCAFRRSSLIAFNPNFQDTNRFIWKSAVLCISEAEICTFHWSQLLT